MNVERGQFCLPSGDLEELGNTPMNALVEKVNRYIGFTSEGACRANNGFFKKLTEAERESLFFDDDEYNKVYRDNMVNMKKRHLELLEQLLGILQKLETSTKINNEALNILSLETKKRLDELYMICQCHYLTAILALFDANLKTTPANAKMNKQYLEVLQRPL